MEAGLKNTVRAALVAALWLGNAVAFAAPPSTGNTASASHVRPEVQAPSGGWNPWPIDGSGYPEVNCITGCSGGAGTTGAASPSSAGLTGYTNGSGNLTAVSPSTPLPTTGTLNQPPFSGSSSIATITSSVTAVIASGARTVLAYNVSGATTDYACAVWAASAPTFSVSGTGAAASCGVAGSFLLSGQSSYPGGGAGGGTPNASGQALYAQYLGTVSDSFTVSAQW